jgi:heptaprenyl diphosphate synthase
MPLNPPSSSGSKQVSPPLQASSPSITQLALLLSAALVLQLIEGLLPPLGLPGAKLGLANTVVLLSLIMWGWRPALFLAILRQLLGGMLSGKLFSIGFFFGLGGALASIAAMQCLLAVFRPYCSLPGVSVFGALSHNWAQWLVARWLMGHEALIWYLPLLTLAAVPCGLLVAMIALPLQNLFRLPAMQFPRLRKAEIAVMAALVFFSFLFPMGWMEKKRKADTAVVFVNGRAAMELDLKKKDIQDINNGKYHYTVAVEEGGVRVLKANCPDQICVYTGLIKKPSQSIICVPGRMVIRIQAGKVPYDALLP